MKIQGAVALGFLGLIAQGALAADHWPRPQTLQCESKGAYGPAAKFTLSKFDTRVPETDLDARTDFQIEQNATATNFCANNGCDNNYCFVFSTEQLERAAQGKLTEVKGMMSYFNSDMPEGLNGGTDGVTVAIDCKVLKN